jgi:hypothetical protein
MSYTFRRLGIRDVGTLQRTHHALRLSLPHPHVLRADTTDRNPNQREPEVIVMPLPTLSRAPYSLIADELAALRWSAYVRDGKRTRDSAPGDFVDIWDPRSEVVVARVREDLVGSVRVIPRITVAEIRAVHGFEGDVPVIFLAKDLGIQRLFGGSTDALWPNWQQCGFTCLGVSYPFASLNSSVHRLMLMDTDTAVSGRDASNNFRALLARGSAISEAVSPTKCTRSA